jgi:aryl-alcohol dehydrogenase-like predicted oxidoreductase
LRSAKLEHELLCELTSAILQRRKPQTPHKPSFIPPKIMQTNPYGNSSLSVSVLGLGAGQIGGDAQSEAQVAQLLNAALDMGVTLIDTARGYGLSEARIGRHLAHRRSEFVLSTKVGYGIEGVQDWTAQVIEAGVDAALRLLKTDHIEIVHLHSCELPTLQAGDVIDALTRVRDKGKIGIAAYSGENEALAWAIDNDKNSAKFAGLECSVNLFDQASLNALLPRANAQGMGVIAKRALGNAPWRFSERPAGDYCEPYWQRMQQLEYDTSGMPWDEFALRFVAYQPEVSSAIVGTSSLAHLQHNVALVEKGPLPEELVQAVRTRFAMLGAGWRGEI